MQGVQQCHFSTSILSYHFKYPCNISNPSPQKFVMENLFLPCDQTFIFMGSVFFEKCLSPKSPRWQVFLHLMLDLTNAERSLPGDPGGWSQRNEPTNGRGYRPLQPRWQRATSLEFLRSICEETAWKQGGGLMEGAKNDEQRVKFSNVQLCSEKVEVA